MKKEFGSLPKLGQDVRSSFGEAVTVEGGMRFGSSLVAQVIARENGTEPQVKAPKIK